MHAWRHVINSSPSWCKWVPIVVYEFVILVHFLSQTNYVACHSSSFYQVLGRPNDPKKMKLASLVVPVPVSEYYQQNKTFWVLKAYWPGCHWCNGVLVKVICAWKFTWTSESIIMPLPPALDRCMLYDKQISSVKIHVVLLSCYVISTV